ncbi:MAG TPA: hypothetical protein VF905_11510 [Nitrospirota bacterium]
MAKHSLETRHFPGMILMILRLLSLIPTALRPRSELALENVELRQQPAVLKRRCRQPKLRKLDRFFWIQLSRSCEYWKEIRVTVKLDTVVRWHRRRSAFYWARLSGSNCSSKLNRQFPGHYAQIGLRNRAITVIGSGSPGFVGSYSDRVFGRHTMKSLRDHVVALWMDSV